MKILFVIESPRIKYHYLTKLQPLGVLYIASYLESKNIDVDVLDFNVEKRRKFNPNNYDLIGYSVTSGNIELTLDSIKWAKSLNPKIKILIGGPMVSLSPKELILNKDVDVCVEGEAENTVYKYLISSDKSKIKGLWLKKNGKPYYTGKSKPIGNLDILPFPAIEKVPFKDYHVVFKKTKNVIALITSRGCPYTCIFCHHSLGFKFRARSPENVVMEIERNIKNFGINEFWIADDNFTMDIDRVEKICDLIISKKLKIVFSLANGVRADKLDEKLLKKLKVAGCWFLTIAPESGSTTSLEKIHKGFTLEQALLISKICKKIGIKTMSNFIIGFPWEEKKDVIKTIEFAKKLNTDVTHFSRLIPYPGTPLWNLVNRSKYKLKDEAHNEGTPKYKHPNISDDEFKYLIKKAYRETMLKPRKIWNLFRMLKIRDFISLGKYSLSTKSI